MDKAADSQMAVQLERIIRRVKQSMRYRGSYSTRDILGSLVARWVNSGEWDRLKEMPPDQRRLGESVRRFILDRFQQLRRRGDHQELAGDQMAIPDHTALVELVEIAELRRWIVDRVRDLESGVVDPRVRIPLSDASRIGTILRLHLEEHTQRQIASELEISLGVVNKRLAEGTNYLVLLQSIEQGLA